MSLLIDQLAAYLATQGEGRVGVDLFKLHRPASPVACVSLHATGGYPPHKYTRQEYPTVQVVARAATPSGALAKAYHIVNLLHGRQQLDLGNDVFANTIQGMNSPVYLGEEEAGNGQHLASFNLVFDLKIAST
ncbi:MAG: minor capsid protein [Armatimonadota bacterium]